MKYVYTVTDSSDNSLGIYTALAPAYAAAVNWATTRGGIPRDRLCVQIFLYCGVDENGAIYRPQENEVNLAVVKAELGGRYTAHNWVRIRRKGTEVSDEYYVGVTIERVPLNVCTDYPEINGESI